MTENKPELGVPITNEQRQNPFMLEDDDRERKPIDADRINSVIGLLHAQGGFAAREASDLIFDLLHERAGDLRLFAVDVLCGKAWEDLMKHIEGKGPLHDDITPYKFLKWIRGRNKEIYSE